MAYAKWQYPFTLTPEQRAEKARLDEVDKLEHPLPEGSNRELHRVFFAALVEKRAKWMDESKDYCKCESYQLVTWFRYWLFCWYRGARFGPVVLEQSVTLKAKLGHSA